MQRRTFLLTTAGGLSGYFFCDAVRAAGDFSVAVVPQVPVAEIDAEWTPFLRELSARSGTSMRLTLRSTIPEFETYFSAGTPDFIYCNPYHVVMANRAAGYIPLVRRREALKGLLVTKRDGPVQKLADLAGKTILFPAPNAFGASLYLRALLTERDKINFTSQYVKTHTNVFRGVILGQGAAGGAIQATFDREPKEVRDELRILFETPPAAPHALCAHPRVPADVRQAVSRAILDASNATMQRLLPREQLNDPISADYARDYAVLDRLKVERFVVRN